MKTKKYEKYNINRNSGIYFVIGLNLILLVTYIAFEWKTYNHNSDWDLSLEMETELIEDVPFTRQLKKLPPPKVVRTPPILEIHEDEDDVIESLIESSESDINTEIVSIDSIPVIDDPDDEEIPWISISEVPVFPGCENAKDKRACFQKMIEKHVRRHFRYPETAIEMGLEGKVYTQFTIRKDGSIGKIRLRGPHHVLEAESERIISQLPRMKPGKQWDKAVSVSFAIPIIYRLQ